MSVRINVNSCKNALGTVFLLATAFFVCSTFISMRSVFAEPIAPENTGATRSGRQSPRSTATRTSNRTVSRSTVSRGTTNTSRTNSGSRSTVARGTTSRATVSRGAVASRATVSRAATASRPNANVVSRTAAGRANVTSRGATTNNRSVRARSTNTARVAATGNVTAADRASINTTYSYLTSRLYSGNYANIVDSTTGLISADAYANCMDSYYACMDEVCTARSAAKGRCSCAGRANNFLAAEEALELANEELITLSGQLSLLISTKGKGDEIAAAFTLTEAEQVMNCVSYQEIKNAEDAGLLNSDTTININNILGTNLNTATKYSYSSVDAWCNAHGFENGCEAPAYCNNNSYGFKLNDLTSPSNLTGSSSDIMAQLKSWAQAKELASQVVTDNGNNIGTSLSRLVKAMAGNNITINLKEASNDTLAKKWGYKLFEYAHNNVCGRVLDSCFNGIYEACGTAQDITDSDGKKFPRCMNGATGSCPYNYNSYITVNTDPNKSNYGEVKLNVRDKTGYASAECFGYSGTTTKRVLGNSYTGKVSASTGDPYVNLRAPIADARRSIMQKYLLDANAACDTYGEALAATAQNINYQKVAAEQALQQKRLEFKQQEDSTTKSNYETYADNFTECIDELLQCYSEADETWTTARIKTYCAQKTNAQHCYEPMVCSPSHKGISAVIDKADTDKCLFAQNYKKNTCRNVVTINEILYHASSDGKGYDKYDSLNYCDAGTESECNGNDGINSAQLRESCLLEAGVETIRKWTKAASGTTQCTAAELYAADPNASDGEKTTGTACRITECRSGYKLFRTRSGDKCVRQETGDSACAGYVNIAEDCSVGTVFDTSDACTPDGTSIKYACASVECESTADMQNTPCGEGYTTESTCKAGTAIYYKCKPVVCEADGVEYVSGDQYTAANGWDVDTAYPECVSAGVTYRVYKAHNCGEDYVTGDEYTAANGWDVDTAYPECVSAGVTYRVYKAHDCAAEYTSTTSVTCGEAYDETSCVSAGITYYACIPKSCPENSTFTPDGPASTITNPYLDRKIRGFVNGYCRCNSGYSVWNGTCKTSCVDQEYRNEEGVCTAGCPNPINAYPAGGIEYQGCCGYALVPNADNFLEYSYFDGSDDDSEIRQQVQFQPDTGTAVVYAGIKLVSYHGQCTCTTQVLSNGDELYTMSDTTSVNVGLAEEISEQNEYINTEVFCAVQ